MMFMAKNSMPAKKEILMILGKRTYFLQQQYFTITISSETMAKETRKTASMLKLKPAFLIKLASKLVSLYGSGASIS